MHREAIFFHCLLKKFCNFLYAVLYFAGPINAPCRLKFRNGLVGKGGGG